MEIELIKTSKHLSAYKEEWKSILSDMENKIPSLEYEFFSSWWTFLGQSELVEVYAVKENLKMIAFFPFRVERASKVTFFRSTGMSKVISTGFVIRKQDIDRVFMYLFDTLMKIEKHCIFDLKGFTDKEQVDKLSNYLLARDFPRKNSVEEMPYVSASSFSRLLFLPLEEKTYLESIGQLEVKVAQLPEVKEALVECSEAEQAFLWNINKEKTEVFQVVARVLLFQSEAISYLIGLTCRGSYVSFGSYSQKEFKPFYPERVLLTETLKDIETSYSTFIDSNLPTITTTYQNIPIHHVAFSSKTFLSRYMLFRNNYKQSITKVNASQSFTKRTDKKIIIAKLSGIKGNKRHTFKKFSKEDYSLCGDKMYILQKIADGFEGFYTRHPSQSVWVNQKAIIVANEQHSMEDHSIFLVDWEQEDLEKVLSFIQHHYNPKHIYLSVDSKDKNNRKKLKLFGFQYC